MSKNSNSPRITAERISQDKAVITATGKILKAGEVTKVCVPLPLDALIENIELEGNCSCGGKLRPSKTEKMTWVCERDNWWHFWNRKHAKLKAELEVLPPSKGNA
jgi:hypothetical protein